MTPPAATASPPEQAVIMPMVYGYIQAWLVGDYWTIARIVEAMREHGVTAEQAAECATLAAAALLTEAIGAPRAAALAERRIQAVTGREARHLAEAERT